MVMNSAKKHLNFCLVFLLVFSFLLPTFLIPAEIRAEENKALREGDALNIPIRTKSGSLENLLIYPYKTKSKTEGSEPDTVYLLPAWQFEYFSEYVWDAEKNRFSPKNQKQAKANRSLLIRDGHIAATGPTAPGPLPLTIVESEDQGLLLEMAPVLCQMKFNSKVMEDGTWLLLEGRPGFNQVLTEFEQKKWWCNLEDEFGDGSGEIGFGNVLFTGAEMWGRFQEYFKAVSRLDFTLDSKAYGAQDYESFMLSMLTDRGPLKTAIDSTWFYDEAFGKMNASAESEDDFAGFIDDLRKRTGTTKGLYGLNSHIISYFKSLHEASKMPKTMDKAFDEMLNSFNKEVKLDVPLKMLVKLTFEISNYYYNSCLMVKDHLNMLDAVYGDDKRSYYSSQAPRAARRVFKEYQEKIWYKLGREMVSLGVDKVIGILTSAVVGNEFAVFSLGFAIRDLLAKTVDPYAASALSGLGQYGLMWDVRRDAMNKYDFYITRANRSPESLEKARLSALMAMMANRQIWKVLYNLSSGRMAEPTGGIKDRARSMIEESDRLIVRLYASRDQYPPEMNMDQHKANADKMRLELASLMATKTAEIEFFYSKTDELDAKFKNYFYNKYAAENTANPFIVCYRGDVTGDHFPELIIADYRGHEKYEAYAAENKVQDVPRRKTALEVVKLNDQNELSVIYSRETGMTYGLSDNISLLNMPDGQLCFFDSEFYNHQGTVRFNKQIFRLTDSGEELLLDDKTEAYFSEPYTYDLKQVSQEEFLERSSVYEKLTAFNKDNKAMRPYFLFYGFMDRPFALPPKQTFDDCFHLPKDKAWTAPPSEDYAESGQGEEVNENAFYAKLKRDVSWQRLVFGTWLSRRPDAGDYIWYEFNPTGKLNIYHDLGRGVPDVENPEEYDYTYNTENGQISIMYQKADGKTASCVFTHNDQQEWLEPGSDPENFFGPFGTGFSHILGIAPIPNMSSRDFITPIFDLTLAYTY